MPDKWPTVGRQMANCRLMNDQQLADSFPNLSQCRARNNVFGVFFLRQIASSKLS